MLEGASSLPPGGKVTPVTQGVNKDPTTIAVVTATVVGYDLDLCMLKTV